MHLPRLANGRPSEYDFEEADSELSLFMDLTASTRAQP